MSESLRTEFSTFPHMRAANALRKPPHNVAKAQAIVEQLRENIQHLAPLVSQRMIFALGKTFPENEILTKRRTKEYTRARAWMAFFLLYHPGFAIDGAPPSLNALSKAMRLDRSAIQHGLDSLFYRMTRDRFSAEVYQLVWIAKRLEDEGMEPFDISPFCGVERKER